MLLDDIQKFINEYHLIGWGIGGFVTATIITLFFKDVVGRCFFKKDKTPLRSKKKIEQFKVEQTEE